MTRSTSIALKRNKLVVGGVATLAVIVALLSALVLGRAAVVADDEIPSPTPVVTPEPSAPESPSEEPSETPLPSLPQAPTPAPSEPADPLPVAKPLDGVLAPGSVVRVTVESIKLRDTPSTEAVIAEPSSAASSSRSHTPSWRTASGRSRPTASSGIRSPS